MEKEKEKRRIRIPFIPNFIYATAALIHVRLHYHIKIDRKVLNKQKRGSIIIYNHSSNKDQFFVKAGVGFKRVNYVLARYFYYNHFLAFFLNWARAISKDQFKPDIIAIRKMKRVVEAKGHVMTAPAGQITIDGTIPYIPESLVKLIKICDCDVLAMQMRGIYLSFPKWRKSKRKCKNVSLTFSKVLEKEELKQLSDEEIYERLVNSVSVNEYELQKTDPWPIKGDELTKGLEDLLVKCPKCGAKHSFKSLGNTLVCDKCNTFIKMNEYGLLEFKDKEGLTFDNIHDWFVWQEDKIYEDFMKHPLLEMTGAMHTNLIKEDTLEYSGSGTVTLDLEGMHFKGNLYGEEKSIDFNTKIMAQLPFDCGVRIDIPDMNNSYRFYPDNPNLIIDFVQIISHWNKIQNNKN